jgi:serine/threonine-protein kinase
MLLTSNDAVFVKILDFGIAQNVGPPGTRLTPTGAALGTSHYMSPEQARGESQVGPATDVYSLGVILYELLSDQRPHPGESYAAVLFHILTKPPVPLLEVAPSCPPELCAVVDRCLRGRPEDRYANAEELLAALDALGDDVPVRERVASKVEGPHRGRFWLGLASGTALGILLAAGATWHALGRRQPPMNALAAHELPPAGISQKPRGPGAPPAPAESHATRAPDAPATTSGRSLPPVARAPSTPEPRLASGSRSKPKPVGSTAATQASVRKSGAEPAGASLSAPSASAPAFVSRNPYD